MEEEEWSTSVKEKENIYLMTMKLLFNWWTLIQLNIIDWVKDFILLFIFQF